MSNNFEEKLVDFLTSNIKADTLRDGIVGWEKLRQTVAKLRDPHLIPSFSVDLLCRHALAKSGLYVESVLSGLEMISRNKSISAVAGEILRPDIIAFNRAQGVIVIFEIKHDAQTEREALTELLGYEQEVKNHFPFTSSFDICFVIVAREWSTLLRHSAASLASWSGKKILCLEASGIIESPRLEVVSEDSWHPISSIGIPDGGFKQLELLLKGRIEQNIGLRLVSTAMDMIVRNGDLQQSHGFVVGWYFPTLVENNFRITINTISAQSYFFLDNPLRSAVRQSEFSKFFEKTLPQRNCATFGASADKAIMAEAVGLLNDYWSVEVDSSSSWKDSVNLYKRVALPIAVDCWGQIGEYSRYFTTIASVRNFYMAHIGSGGLDWRHPWVGLSILADITNERFLQRGSIGVQELFTVGALLGTTFEIDQKESHLSEDFNPYLAERFWNFFEVLMVHSEFKSLLARSELFKGFPEIEFALGQNAHATKDFHNWILHDLLNNADQSLKSAFILGSAFAWLMQYEMSDANLMEYFEPECERALPVIEEIMKGIEVRAKEDIQNGYLKRTDTDWLNYKGFSNERRSNLALAKRKKRKNLDASFCLSNFVDKILPIASKVILPLPIVLESIMNGAIDWDWIKGGIRRLHEDGKTHPCVHLLADGAIRTGIVDPTFSRYLEPIVDPELEVYCWEDKGAFSMAVKTTWTELICRITGMDNNEK